MAIRYSGRKRQEAEGILKKLRGFYNERNDPAYRNAYSLQRNFVNFKVKDKRTGAENPVKSLKRIKGNIKKRLGYSLKEALAETDKFSGAFEKDRITKGTSAEEIERNYLGYKSRELSGRLELWAKEAEPILEEIIDQNLEQMIGFKYYSQYSKGMYGEGEIYEEIARGNERPDIYFQNQWRDKKFYVQPSSAYGEYNFLEETEAKSIASKILGQIVPDPNKEGIDYVTEWVTEKESMQKGIAVIDISEGIGKERVGRLLAHRESEVLAKKRNQIVKEIENRTGRNLKREVYEARRNAER